MKGKKSTLKEKLQAINIKLYNEFTPDYKNCMLICISCNCKFKSTKLSNYKDHLATDKHKKNKKIKELEGKTMKKKNLQTYGQKD